MTKEVYVFPRSPAAAEWLSAKYDDLRRVFLEVHRGNRIGVSLDHPHNLEVMSGESARWDPEEPPVYIYVPCHWNSEHLRTTEEDVRKVLRRLGASFDDFEIEASE